MKPLKAIDMFSGAGCFSRGFELAGIEIMAGIDNWDIAIESYKLNFPKAQAILANVETMNLSRLSDCNIMIGSPPCQEWSLGKNDKRSFDKYLITAFMHIIEQKKPQFWCWECAPETIKILDSCRYEAILNAYDFGVPQNRLRAFHANFPLPNPADYEKGKTVDETFGWAEPKVLFNHRSLNRNAYSPIYLSNKPARTAVTWPIRIYKEDAFSVEMMKQIQGIPTDFMLTGTKQEQFKQIGNAVCPPVAQAIAEKIKEQF